MPRGGAAVGRRDAARRKVRGGSRDLNHLCRREPARVQSAAMSPTGASVASPVRFTNVATTTRFGRSAPSRSPDRMTAASTRPSRSRVRTRSRSRRLRGWPSECAERPTTFVRRSARAAPPRNQDDRSATSRDSASLLRWCDRRTDDGPQGARTRRLPTSRDPRARQRRRPPPARALCMPACRSRYQLV